MNNRYKPLTVLNPTVSLILLASLALLYSLPTMAESNNSNGISPGPMAVELIGGLALFLFGMEQMAESLKAVAGDRMKIILARLTSNRFLGASTGAFITAVIQSSSITTVLVVSFITAGMMSFSQSIGVIMGSNIGTTITAQIVAFKVTKAALPMISIGFAMLFFSRRDQIRRYGGILMGLGMVFFGMSIMSDAMKPLRTFQPFLDLMIQMEAPFIGILVAAGFTALIQSSSATTGIVIVMASQGFISLPAGIALAFGANIGTCVTALLASIGKSREALRATVAHIAFNVTGVLIWVGFIDQLSEAVTLISPIHNTLAGSARLAAETPRQIANAHTIFNLANTFLLIWFTPQIARLIEWLVPDKPLREIAYIESKYLSDDLLDTPSLALEGARMELVNMGDQIYEMLNKAMPVILHGNHASLTELRAMDDRVDHIYGQVVTYLAKLSRRELTNRQNVEFLQLMGAANHLENIGDVIETDLVALGHTRLKKNISVSRPTEEMLNDYHQLIKKAITLSIKAVTEHDQGFAEEVLALENSVVEFDASAAQYEALRLTADAPHRLSTYTVEITITEKFRRIYFLCKRLVNTLAPDQDAAEKETEKETEQ